jgi:hypothetical protein
MRDSRWAAIALLIGDSDVPVVVVVVVVVEVVDAFVSGVTLLDLVCFAGVDFLDGFVAFLAIASIGAGCPLFIISSSSDMVDGEWN